LGRKAKKGDEAVPLAVLAEAREVVLDVQVGPVLAHGDVESQFARLPTAVQRPLEELAVCLHAPSARPPRIEAFADAEVAHDIGVRGGARNIGTPLARIQ
jgi:hypothetical protein